MNCLLVTQVDKCLKENLEGLVIVTNAWEGCWSIRVITIMRFAYADPPYLGCCSLYDHHHPDGLCWDDLETHRKLITTLWLEYDGWALSASSSSLKQILSVCPDDVRIAAWVKPFCAFKRNVRPCYAWEPVIFHGGRNPSNGHSHPPPVKGGKQTTPKDFIAESITLQKGLTGAKPEKVCEWILDLLNVQEGDEVVDLFPGTGIMTRTAKFRTQRDTLADILFTE